MIIDIHSHIGSSLKWNLEEETLLKSLEKYHIDFTIVSNIESSEVDNDQLLIEKPYQVSQYDSNFKTIEFAKKNKDKVGAAIWVKPLTEGVDDKLINLIKENRQYIYAIKIHPYHSKINFNSIEVRNYIDLAQMFNLPVITHTANTFDTSVYRVYEVAKDYPNVNFVMVHMGLCTDNLDAIEVLKKDLSNIYADTTWVNYKIAVKAIKECNHNRIMFGTDNTIDGLDTYGKEIYQDYFTLMKKEISKEDYDKLMYKTAIDVFKIQK